MIEDWRKWWRMFSVQMLILAGTLQAAWDSLPPDVVAMLSPETVRWVTVTLCVLGVVGRLIKQRDIAS